MHKLLLVRIELVIYGQLEINGILGPVGPFRVGLHKSVDLAYIGGLKPTMFVFMFVHLRKLNSVFKFRKFICRNLFPLLKFMQISLLHLDFREFTFSI